MSVHLIAKKIGMTQVYDDQNRLLPVTVVEAGPCPVIQVKSGATDGYEAVQIAYKPQKPHRLTQAEQGHFKRAGVQAHAYLKEFRTEGIDRPFTTGEILDLTAFEEGQFVDVIGQGKGKGFQGVVKRFGYAGGPASHGSMFHRRGGSYGRCQWPGEVDKGKPMPGRMGNHRRTTQNLQVVKILPEKNVMLIKGSFPGANGSLIEIRPAKKKKKRAA